MQAQGLRYRSFSSVAAGLLAAGVLLVGGAAGYALRSATVSPGDTARTVFIDRTAAACAPSDFLKVSKSRPEPQ